MVGMGACVGQELAIRRPELVRSLFQTGSWAYADPALTDQLTMMRRVHQELGFEAFQMLCASLSFTPAFYDRHRDRLLGPDGAWGDLIGRADAHARLVAACLDHDTRDRLDQVRVPCFVLHAGRDPITTVDHTGLLADLLPRLSRRDVGGHVARHRRQGAEAPPGCPPAVVLRRSRRRPGPEVAAASEV